MWTIIEVFIEFVRTLFLFYFWFFGHEACGILVPQPRIEPSLPVLEGEVWTTGLPGTSHVFLYNPEMHPFQRLFALKEVFKNQWLLL